MWQPDEDDKTWEMEENTLIREAEQKGKWRTGVEESFISALESSDGEGRGEPDVREEEMGNENRGIDVLKELHQMSLPSSPDSVSRDSFSNVGYEMLGKVPATPFHENSICDTSDELSAQDTPSDNKYQELAQLGYPLKRGTVTVPDFGTFKVKQGFQSLVTPQMIKRMLSQSILSLLAII